MKTFFFKFCFAELYHFKKYFYIRQRPGLLHLIVTPCVKHSSANAFRFIHTTCFSSSAFSEYAQASITHDSKYSLAVTAILLIHSLKGEFWFPYFKTPHLSFCSTSLEASAEHSGKSSVVLQLSLKNIYLITFAIFQILIALPINLIVLI